MPRFIKRTLAASVLLGLTASCTQEAEPPEAGLLQFVPAETPYVFVTREKLPDGLRDKLGNYYAAQLASQRKIFASVREQIEAEAAGSPESEKVAKGFDILDAILSEFEGHESIEQVRELGLEPAPRSVIYGIGVLPAMRVEISDAAKFNAMLDRVEQKAGVAADRAKAGELEYRRIDMGPVDAVLAVTDQYAIAGALVDSRFDTDLPLLLGQSAPEKTLADNGDIRALTDKYGFVGYGEGFIKVDTLLSIALGKATGRNAEIMKALQPEPVPMSAGCSALTEGVVANMPRMVAGITEAKDERMVARFTWETSPVVAEQLQKLAAPVPGVGQPYDGMMSVGVGVDLPQLRNGIESLLRYVMNNGAECEWVDKDEIQQAIPQLSMVFGPMTAGVKGFNLQLDELTLDPQTMMPTDVKAGLLAAVDDPRGIFAMGAMFNPALAALDVPSDGTFVDLPPEVGIQAPMPNVKVAMKDQSLMLVAGNDSTSVAQSMLDATPTTPAPLMVFDYGIHKLVEKFGGLVEQTAANMEASGDAAMAQEMRTQLESFRMQAQLFDRVRVSVLADKQGLTMDQVMELR